MIHYFFDYFRIRNSAAINIREPRKHWLLLDFIRPWLDGDALHDRIGLKKDRSYSGFFLKEGCGFESRLRDLFNRFSRIFMPAYENEHIVEQIIATSTQILFSTKNNIEIDKR